MNLLFLQGKAKRNVSRALAAVGRAWNEVQRELEDIHDAEGTLWRKSPAGKRNGELSPSEIMQRVSAQAARVQPVMGTAQRREEVRFVVSSTCNPFCIAHRSFSDRSSRFALLLRQRGEHLRRALGPEMDGAHWEDRKKLEVLDRLRSEAAVCAPVTRPMEIEAEEGEPNTSVKDLPPTATMSYRGGRACARTIITYTDLSYALPQSSWTTRR